MNLKCTSPNFLSVRVNVTPSPSHYAILNVTLIFDKDRLQKKVLLLQANPITGNELITGEILFHRFGRPAQHNNRAEASLFFTAAIVEEKKKNRAHKTRRITYNLVHELKKDEFRKEKKIGEDEDDDEDDDEDECFSSGTARRGQRRKLVCHRCQERNNHVRFV